MAIPIETDEMAFEDFVKNFHGRIKRTLSIKRRLMQRKYFLFKRAKTTPKTVYSDDFNTTLRTIVSRERTLHRLTEAALEKAGEYITRIEADAKVDARKVKAGGKAIRNAIERLNNINALLAYLKRRMAKMDKRLKKEEHFLETRDKRYLLAFLKEYKKEINEDLLLEREIVKLSRTAGYARANVAALEGSISHNLKRAGIKVTAAAAIPLTPVALPVLKVFEVMLRPLTHFIVDIFMAVLGFGWHDSLRELEESSITEKMKYEIETTLGLWKGMVEDLIEIVVETPYPGLKKKHLFSDFKL
jgi:hypothetical protein